MMPRENIKGMLYPKALTLKEVSKMERRFIQLYLGTLLFFFNPCNGTSSTTVDGKYLSEIVLILQKLKLGKSVFKNTDTYKDQNVENEQVWLD